MDIDSKIKILQIVKDLEEEIHKEFTEAMTSMLEIRDERDYYTGDFSKELYEQVNNIQLKGERKRLQNLMKKACKILTNADSYASRVQYAWQCHTWNWKDERDYEELHAMDVELCEYID
jgi:uncharacterized membrane-anchored protein YitT (DUF2179 family)